MDEQTVPMEWRCDLCDYFTKRKSDYRRHLSSSKHVERIAPAAPRKKLSCICGKTYSHNSGLSRHKTSCDQYKRSIEHNEVTFDVKSHKCENNKTKVTNKLLGDLLRQMRDLKEIVPTSTHNVTNTNNNYIVNLNVFLNEQCKDALSLDDFVKQIEFVFDDLNDATWRSKVLLNNLGSLQIEDRPFHCVDPTTCQVVLKNGKQWQQGGKDELAYTLDSCGKQVQMQFGNKWEHTFPGWTTSETQNKKYMSLWRHISTEPTKEQLDEEVRHISNESVIPNGKLQNG